MAASTHPIFEYALALGDDALVLGQRIAEWCSNGPYLEEDIALSNVALDYIGRARMLLSYAGEAEGQGRNEDQLAFTRDCRDFRNLLIYELPRGDFGFTMARQLAVDAFEVPFFEALTRSSDRTLAGIAGKALKESRYHLRHSSGWVIRLGAGTDESHRRMQDGLDQVWGYTPELFQMDAAEAALAESGVAVDRAELRQQWDSTLDEVLKQATLGRPADDWQIDGGRRGVHTEHLGHLLSELQFMQRAYPGLEW